MLSCVSRTTASTYILLASSDDAESVYERDVAAGIIEALTNGCIEAKYVSSKELMKFINTCFSINSSPLALTLQKKDEVVLEMHRVGFEPTPTKLSIDELEHVSTVFSHGKIRLGPVVGSEEIIAKLSEDHVYRHIVIVGATGSGKSTTAAVIAVEAARAGFKVLIVDWHGEYHSILSSVDEIPIVYTNPLNSIVPKHMNFTDIVSKEPLAFIEILEAGLELTPAQVHILEDALNVIKGKNLKGYIIDLIVDIVQASSTSARWYTESREALLRKLKPLTSQYLAINWTKCEYVDLTPGSVTIFDVSSIPNVRVRKILTSLLIRSLALDAQYSQNPTPLLVVVDEAHNVFENENPVSMLIAEVRKWNFGFALISQAPSMLAPIVLKNANTKIIHALKTTHDVNAVLSNTILERDVVKEITSLKPGEAYLSIPEIEKPVRIKIDISLIGKKVRS